MIRLPRGAALLAAIALAACSDDTAYTYRPSASVAAVTGSGAAGENLPPQITVGTAAAPERISAVSAQGVDFVFQAGFFGAGAVRMAQLAPQHASAPQIRGVAGTILRDIQVQNAALASIGNTIGVAPPAVGDSGREAAALVLKGLSGPMFDRQYLEEQISEHRAAVALFGAESERGQDPDLRTFAAQYLPTLQAHLDQLTAAAAVPVASIR